MGRYLPTGIVKGLGVTGGTMLRTIFPDPKKPIPNPVKGADTVQYPHEKEITFAPFTGLEIMNTRIEEEVLVVPRVIKLMVVVVICWVWMTCFLEAEQEQTAG